MTTSLDGFRYFHKFHNADHDVGEKIPPSLKNFFYNFDCFVEYGTFPLLHPNSSHHRLLLRAITIQGVPVEDMPVLDIYDSKSNLIYTSISSIDVGTDDWGDEEGFYKINTKLTKDFCIICRFKLD